MMTILGNMQTCVYEVQQNFKDFSLHSKDLHLLFVCLSHPPREQGREVRAASSKHQAVDPEDTTTNLKPHITEISAVPHLVYLSHNESGIAV